MLSIVMARDDWLCSACTTAWRDIMMQKSVYLTKIRKVSLMMDAVESDDRPDAFEGLREYEERIGRAISRGYSDMMNGRVRPLAQAVQDAERIRSVRCED